MLRLQISPGSGFEKAVEAASRHFDKILSESYQRGYIRIASYPSPDALIAAAAIFSIASSNGVNPILSVDYKPPQFFTEPAILVGYTNPGYKSGFSEWPLMAIAPEISSTPPPGAVYVEGEGSIAGILAMIVNESKEAGVKTDAMRLLAAAVQLGGNVDPNGRVFGLDKTFYESVAREMLGLDMILSIKAYRPVSLTVCHSIASTLDPVYPGLIGDPEACSEYLRDEGLASLIDRTLASLEDNEIERLAITILRRVGEVVGREPDPAEYIGYLPIARKDPYTEDPRMLAHTLVYSVEFTNSLAPLIEAAVSPHTFIPSLTRWSEVVAFNLREGVDEIEVSKVKVQPWLQTYRVRYDGRLPETLAWRLLSLSGKVSRDALILFEEDDRLCGSVLQAEAANTGIVKRLVETKTAELEGMRYCVRGNAMD